MGGLQRRGCVAPFAMDELNKKPKRFTDTFRLFCFGNYGREAMLVRIESRYV